MAFNMFTISFFLLTLSVLSLSTPNIPRRQTPNTGHVVEVTIKGGTLDGQSTNVHIEVSTLSADVETGTMNTAGTFAEPETQEYVKRVKECFIAGCDTCRANFEEAQAVKCVRCLPGHVLFKALMKGNVVNGVTVPSAYSETETDICLPALTITLNKDREQADLKETIAFLGRIDPSKILIGQEVDREGGGGREKADVTVAFGQSPPPLFWPIFDSIQAAVMGKAQEVVRAGIKSVEIHRDADESFRFVRTKLGRIDVNARQEIRNLVEKYLVSSSSSSSGGGSQSSAATTNSTTKKREAHPRATRALIDSSRLAVFLPLGGTCTLENPTNGLGPCSYMYQQTTEVNGHTAWYSPGIGFSTPDGSGSSFVIKLEAASTSSSTKWTVYYEQTDIASDGSKTVFNSYSEESATSAENPWEAAFGASFVSLTDVYFFLSECPAAACGKYSIAAVNNGLSYINVDDSNITISAIGDNSWGVYDNGSLLEVGTGSTPLLASYANGGTCETGGCDATSADDSECFGYMQLGTAVGIEYETYTAYGVCSSSSASIGYITSCTGVNTCFPEGALVTMADGSRKKIEDLSFGETVMTLDHKTGLLAPSEVYAFAHHDEDAKDLSYLVIDCEGDRASLSISPNHYIVLFDSKESLSSRLVPAREVKQGDILQTCDKDNICTKSFVESIRMEKKNGLFAPLTTSGTVVVDGVVASVYAEYGGSASPELMHTFSSILLALPTKAINAIYPSADPSLSSSHQMHPVSSALSTICIALEWAASSFISASSKIIIGA